MIDLQSRLESSRRASWWW